MLHLEEETRAFYARDASPDEVMTPFDWRMLAIGLRVTRDKLMAKLKIRNAQKNIPWDPFLEKEYWPWIDSPQGIQHGEKGHAHRG
jgi:hypothetical protein